MYIMKKHTSDFQISICPEEINIEPSRLNGVSKEPLGNARDLWTSKGSLDDKISPGECRVDSTQWMAIPELIHYSAEFSSSSPGAA